MKLKRLAQSTILLTSESGVTLLIDPGKYNLDPGRHSLETFPTADILIITHKHEDHFDVELVRALWSRRQSFILTNPEIGARLRAMDIPSAVIEPGQTTSHGGFEISAVRTDHVVRDEYVINFGVVVSADGKSVYHTSDTRFIDPSLLPAVTRAQCLVLPISNRGLVMGIDDAVAFAAEMKPHVVVPVHYDSPKDKDRVDPTEFAAKASRAGLSVRLLAFGDETAL